MSKKKGIQTIMENNVTVKGHLWVREAMCIKQGNKKVKYKKGSQRLSNQ